MSELAEKPPKVSVVMPAYNTALFLRQAVDSILAQTFADFELIVIDDGSVDSTTSILESYSDPRMRLIRKAKNEGLILALNLGIVCACGKYWARMDADDIALPKRLELQTKWLDQNPEIAVLGTAAIRIDMNGHHLERMVSVSSPKDVAYLIKVGVAPLVHSSVMMRTDFLRALGGYRVDFSYAEDEDLWLRAIEHGQIAILKEPLLLYRSNPDGIRLSKIVPASHSVAYAMDCYSRRVRREPELSRDEFLVTANVIPYETEQFWACALEMITLGQPLAALRLLEQVLSRNVNHAGAKVMFKLLSGPSANGVIAVYRLYRLMRGWLSGTFLGGWMSILKHRVQLRMREWKP